MSIKHIIQPTFAPAQYKGFNIEALSFVIKALKDIVETLAPGGELEEELWANARKAIAKAEGK